MGIKVVNGVTPTVVDPETQDSLLYWLRNKLNDSDILEETIGISNLVPDKDCACLVVDSTPVKLKSYVDGSYDGSLDVTLFYRVIGKSTSSERLDILNNLNKFNSYLSGLDTSDFTACEILEVAQSELSSLVATYDNDISDYGIKITLGYYK